MSSIKSDHDGDTEFTGAQVDSVVKLQEEVSISTGEEHENPVPDPEAKLCQFDEEEGLDQFHTLGEQASNHREADNPAESSAKTLALEQGNKEAVETSTKSQTSEMNNRGAANVRNMSVKAESSRKRTPKSLKAKSKIKKGHPGGSNQFPGLMEQESNNEGADNPAEAPVKPLALEQSDEEAVQAAMKLQISEINNRGAENAGDTPVKAESVEKGTQQENNNKEVDGLAEASAKPLDLEQRNKEAAMKSQSPEMDDSGTEISGVLLVNAESSGNRTQHEDSCKETYTTGEVSAKPLALEQKEKDAVEASMKSQSSKMSYSGTANPVELPVNAELSKKGTRKSLKAKAKIKKGSPGGSHRLMEQENNSKQVDSPAEASASPSALEQRNQEDVEAAKKSELAEMNNQGAKSAGETLVKAESSKRRTLKSLKAKAKITKGPPGGSNRFQRLVKQENSGKESDSLSEASAKPLGTEQRKEEGVEAAMKLQSSEMDIMGAENAEPKPVKAESSKKGGLKSLKAKTKTKRGSPGSISLKEKNAEKAKDNGHFQGRNREKDKSSCKDKREKNDKEFKNDEDQSSIKLQKNGAKEEHIGEGQETRRNQERIAGSSKNSRCNQKREEKRGGQEKSSMNEMNKEKLDFKEKILGDQKKNEKLGGLIFMCNSKTKPDCFGYRVMGVTAGKKDLVLGVKPGLKLFLYDFDLRLMYGIYKASSSGGMRLEPKAFNGSFPVQVRFSVHKDCVPLPESVFKKAIKDNYDKTNKFDIQLSVQQVKKLSELFCSVPYQLVKPVAVPVHSAPVSNIQDRGTYEKLRDSVSNIQDRGTYEKLRDSQLRSDGEGFMRTNGDRSYPVLSPERDQHIERREVILTRREEAPCDLYMGEKEYRMYGLQRGKRNLTPPRAAASTLDPYSRNLEREHLLRQPPLPYSDRVPMHGESVLADPIYSTQKEFQTNHIGGRNDVSSFSAVPSSSAVTALDSYIGDPYYSYQYSSSSMNSRDPYLLPARREETSSGSYYSDGRRETYLAKSDPLYRRESDSVEKLYLKYGVEPLSDYKQVYQGGAKHETLPQPVSSRYSFAGPSLSHRN